MTNPAAASIMACCYGNYEDTTRAAYMQFCTLQNTINARIVQNRDVDFIGRTSSSVLASGWHFVVATWDGQPTSSGVKLYFDGNAVDVSDNRSGTFTKASAGSDVPLSVGAQLRAGFPVSAQFAGSQRDLRMYNRALSAVEVRQMYTNGLSVLR